MEGSEHVGRGEGDSGGEATSRVWRRAGGMRQLDLEAAKGSGQASVELYNLGVPDSQWPTHCPAVHRAVASRDNTPAA